MKNIFHSVNILFLFVVVAVLSSSCRKEDALVVDVQFRADKTSVSTGETVTFFIGAGADASSLYTGDEGHNFEKSRINLVELQGYTEEELQTVSFADRIEGLQEFIAVVPDFDAVPSDYSFSGGEINLYDGPLVPWDFSNTTDSRYIQFTLSSNAPQTFTFRPNNAVLPTMLDLNNGALRILGAQDNRANNNFSPFVAFPDGFDANSPQNGIQVRFGIEIVVDGQASGVSYFTQPVRELLDNLNFNLNNMINNFQSAFPNVDMTKGIEEMRFTINADNPDATDDDGDLLSYVGNVYIQEMRIGLTANMVKSFDRGVTIPFVFDGTEETFEYTYNTAGTYTVTLVSSFIGRKQYSDDGYRTDRPDEISADEYDIEAPLNHCK